jgi:hypothetical protein
MPTLMVAGPGHHRGGETLAVACRVVMGNGSWLEDGTTSPCPGVAQWHVAHRRDIIAGGGGVLWPPQIVDWGQERGVMEWI